MLSVGMSPERNRRRNARGQAAIFVTMSLVPTMGLIGLVVDVGWSYWRKQAAMTAAEAAANAAAQAAMSATAYSCGGSGGVNCQTTAQNCSSNPVSSPPNDSILTACLYAKQNGFRNSGRQTVTVQSNTSNIPVSGVSGVSYWVKVTVSENISQTFSAVLGNTWSQIKAESISAIFGQAKGACVYALNPSAPDTVLVNGTATVNASCGVYNDSNSSTALDVKGGGNITANTVNIVGNYTDNGGGGTISVMGGGSITTGAAIQPDPFGGVPAPSAPAGHGCDSNGINGGGTIHMPADGYYVVCGNIKLTGNGTQNFPAGIYIVENGGITWNNGTVTGTGVTFYLTANPTSDYGGVSVGGSAKVTLTAPTTGTYHGILFFQDRSIPTTGAAADFEGGSNMNLTGSLYFPTTPIVYTGGSQTSPTLTGLVGNTVFFKGTSYFAADTNGAATGLGLPTVAMLE